MPHLTQLGHRVPAASSTRMWARGRSMLTGLVLLATTAATAVAQSGTVRFGGASSGPPTLDFTGGPTLTFSSRILQGFGNTEVAPATGGALWWEPAQYSGQGMLFGPSFGRTHVLELRFEAAGEFDLFLTGALFGGYLNTARTVGFQLFNDDYSQSTTLGTLLTGADTPGSAVFGASGWGNVVRLQFTETDANGTPNGFGPYYVGIQDIDYRLAPQVDVVPEPSTYVLLATGLAALVVVRRSQRRIFG